MNPPRWDLVYLIDDHPPTNFFHRIVLEDSGLVRRVVDYTAADRALEALEGLLARREAPPELIFLDINMPRMNGWEFLERYAALRFPASAPQVVMLTTSENPDDRQRAEAHDLLTGYRIKPLSEGMLRELAPPRTGAG